MELTKLRLQFDEIIGYNNREFNDILWAWVKRNADKITDAVDSAKVGNQTTETQEQNKSLEQQLLDEYYSNYETTKPDESEIQNLKSLIAFVLNKIYHVQVDNDAEQTKQGFYVKVKIQSKEDLKCIFITDHLVHLDNYLPINVIEHAITDEIQRRIKERENGKYEILAIEKIILALDNPREV